MDNEFTLIKKIQAMLPKTSKKILHGIGDDAAVVQWDASTYQLITTDSLVEHVHFRLSWSTPEQIGQKAIAVNVSDIAAMGGTPTYAVVSLVLPPYLTDDFVTQIYKGIRNAAKKYHVDIVGGNISRGKIFVVDIAMVGMVKKSQLLTRRRALPGDLVAITGTLGNAAAGLELLTHPEVSVSKTDQQVLLSRQKTPKARLDEAQKIAATRRATSMIDISDGVSSDILHICEESRVGVTIYAEKIPISRAVKNAAALLHKNPLHLALDGGEDYELLWTIPEKYEADFPVPHTIIGKITKEKQYVIRVGNHTRVLRPRGWNHLK